MRDLNGFAWIQSKTFCDWLTYDNVIPTENLVGRVSTIDAGVVSAQIFLFSSFDISWFFFVLATDFIFIFLFDISNPDPLYALTYYLFLSWSLLGLLSHMVFIVFISSERSVHSSNQTYKK